VSIHTDIKMLVPALQNRATDALKEMRADVLLRDMGVSSITVVETLRDLCTQMAYYSRGRMLGSQDVKAMYKAAGLWNITDEDADKVITWTLQSKHIKGEAIDIAPMRGGRIWWAAPESVWTRMGEIGEKYGLNWGGRWKTPDCPHYEL
jgi:peptidoglycan L-alanyl-D-glutamate endopeptidase CwlK